MLEPVLYPCPSPVIAGEEVATAGHSRGVSVVGKCIRCRSEEGEGECEKSSEYVHCAEKI